MTDYERLTEVIAERGGELVQTIGAFNDPAPEKHVTFEAWILDGRGLIVARDGLGGVGLWDFIGKPDAPVEEDIAYLRQRSKESNHA